VLFCLTYTPSQDEMKINKSDRLKYCIFGIVFFQLNSRIKQNFLQGLFHLHPQPPSFLKNGKIHNLVKIKCNSTFTAMDLEKTKTFDERKIKFKNFLRENPDLCCINVDKSISVCFIDRDTYH
jgi:hypothetical protein